MKPQWVACAATLLSWTGAGLTQEIMTPHSAKSFDFLGLWTTILLSGDDTGGTSALLDVHIPANSGPRPHIHTREDEVYLIKQGTFQFFMDGVCWQAGPGASLHLAKMHAHTFKNVGQNPGELLLFVYPAGLDRYFREVHDMGLKMPKDLDRLNALSEQKYGLRYLPGYDFHAGACEEIPPSDTHLPDSSTADLVR